MEREIDLKEISDGKLYSANDMVKAGCDDCKGCSDCCRGMGESILLDPLDICRMTVHLECTFDELLNTCVELHVVDGVILPNMKMAGKKEKCPFLNQEGRCNIHRIRPGICRLFPLGRCYEEGSFRYFLQVHECRKEPKTKVKIKKWLDTPNLGQYERFVSQWHYFLKDVQQMLESMQSDGMERKVTLYLLEEFYRKPYEREEEFYEEFSPPIGKSKKTDGICRVGGKSNMKYQWIRSKRKTIAIRIREDGTVIVRSPESVSRKTIEDFLKEKQEWIETHQKKAEQRRAQALTITEEQREEGIKRARKVFPERIAYFAKQMGVTYGRVYFAGTENPVGKLQQ